jgi:hypothetical protein
MLKPEMSLSEAFRRRDEIKQAGRAVYFSSGPGEESYEIDIVEKSHNKPNWYVVTLKRDDDHATALNLPGEMIVTVR